MTSRTSIAPCPKCSTNTVELVFSTPNCTNCGKRWATYREWREEVRTTGVGAPPPPPAGGDDYIASGDMARDVEAVVEIAVLESEFNTIKRIAQDVAKTAQEGVERGDPAHKTLDAVLIYITEEVKAALRKQGKDIE